MTTTREMPRYKCHKEVRALKIDSVDPERLTPEFSGLVCRGSQALGTACGTCERCKWEREHGPAVAGAFIVPAEEGYGPIHVNAEYIRKHDPRPGGYYVVYDDGYNSYSPAKAFEEGYTRI